MRIAKADANQAEIVQALRDIGAYVFVSHTLGRGFPDLVVGYRGKTYLIEVKDGNKPPSQTRLTEDEQRFHDEWRGGALCIVYSVDDAIGVINV